MPHQVALSYCPNHSNIWDTCWTIPEHWDGISLTTQVLIQETAQSTVSFFPILTPSSPYTKWCITLLVCTVILYFTAQSLRFTRFLQNFSVIINNLKLFRTALNNNKYSTLPKPFMHLLTTMGPGTGAFAVSLEKLWHFAQTDYSLQKPGWLLSL